LAATSTKKSSSSSALPLLIIVVIAALGYFLFLRPQQQKNRAARQQSQSFEVGDEVQTIGGIVGRVVEMENDRVTIVTGGDDGNGSPTRLVLLRAAIARKVEPKVAPGDGLRYGNEGEFEDHFDHDDEEHEPEASAVHDEDDGPEESGGDREK
jgi:preprotein translocase subunit YajC